MRPTTLLILPSILVLSASAIADDNADAPPTAPGDQAAPSPAPAPAPGDQATAPTTSSKTKTSGKLTDAQILGVLNAANSGEIEAATLVANKTNNETVTKFADEMTKDHTSMNEQGNALATKLGLQPADSDTSAKLKSSSEEELGKLRDLSGPAFDKAYAQAAVADHKAVLGLIDKKLIHDASSPDLKAMLKKARPIIATHLRHALHLQALVKKEKNAAAANP